MNSLPWLKTTEPPHFPPAAQALKEPNGLLAMGGLLTPDWLLTAYRGGIFPWFSEHEPILWWSPAPRCVFKANPPILSRRMRRWLRQNPQLEITLDHHFSEVIQTCASIPREDQSGTWILPQMQQAYQHLFDLGHATAIAVWLDHELIGGLYGVSIGQMLFAESMFSLQSGGSKIALAATQWLMQQGVWQLIDAQVVNPHLLSLGAQTMPRQEFMTSMDQAMSETPIDRQRVFNSEACIKALQKRG